MSHAAIGPLVRQLLRRQRPGVVADCGDHELLHRFTAQGEERAFTALVERHGPMVRGLCRRLLVDPGLADDVFQATFLVLARRAGSIRRCESLGSWLYGVARRLAYKALRGAARRRRHERLAAASRVRSTPADAGWAELLAVLDEELAQLPEQARAPLLLCYLQGYTQDEAARFLGWSVGTLRRRLEWGRALLRLRLTRRGATLSAGLFATLLAPRAATAAVSENLLAATARSAFAFAAGQAPNTAAAMLAHSALPTLALHPGKAVALFLVILGVLTAGAAGLAYYTSDDKAADPRPAAPQVPDGKPAAGLTPVDRLSDPLPEGALVRFGTTRFRHPGGINGAALAPDGKTIATDGNKLLRLIDTATGRVRLTLKDLQLAEGFDDGARRLAFSPNGKHLLVSGPAVAQLLDAGTGEEIRRFTGRRGSLSGVAFSPDSEQIALTEGTGATFCSAATGEELLRIASSDKPVAGCLAYAPGGHSVALPGTTSSTISICDTATGKEIRHISNGSEVLTIAFAPDGKSLAAASKDHAVHLWDVAAGKEMQALTHELADPARDNLTALAFAPDGKVLAVGTSDSTIHLWNPATGKAVRRLEGHTWWITGLSFSPDGKTLLSTSWDATVRRWDVATGKELRGPENDLDQSHMARSTDGKLLATGGADGTIALWEAATGRKRGALEGHRRGIFALAFSRDGRRLASGGWERTVRVWDLAVGKEEQALTCKPGSERQGRIDALAFSPDGRLLAASDSDRNAVHLWDLSTGKELRELSHRGPTSVAFAPDGKTLAIGGWDHALVLWEVASGEKVRTIPLGKGPGFVDTVVFSPNGRLLATGHHGQHVYLWEAATGKLVRQIEAGHEVTWCLGFSSDGRWLASGGLDGTVNLWEVATGRRLHQLRGHEFWILTLAFGDKDRTLATGGYDGTSLLWTLKPKLEPLPPAGVEPLWKALLEDDGAQAYRAAWTLAEHPDQSIPFLKEHLRALAPRLDRDRVRQWLADLDSDEFDKRETASRELGKLGAAIELQVRAALAKSGSAEARRRLEALLDCMHEEVTPEMLRQGRALGVLERIGNRDAVDLLQSLAKSDDEALRQEAEVALERLKLSGSGRY